MSGDTPLGGNMFNVGSKTKVLSEKTTIDPSRSKVPGLVIVVGAVCFVLGGAVSALFPITDDARNALISFFKSFFARKVEYDNGLELFGTDHLLISAFFLFIYTFVVVFREKIREFGHFEMIRRVMALILLLNMVIHYAGRIIIGEWHFGEDIPLHICFVTNFFIMYVLWTDNKNSLFSVIYYFTVIGPLPAIIFPDLSRSWSGYLFWQFIISHHVMLLFSLYCMFVLEYKTSLRSAISAFICGNIYVALIKLFNFIFGTNYLMLGELPQQLYDLFPFLNVLPALFWLEAAGIIALIAAFIIWRIITKRKTVNKFSL